jgi:hypothetical protein
MIELLDSVYLTVVFPGKKGRTLNRFSKYPCNEQDFI